MRLKLQPITLEVYGKWIEYCRNPDKDEIDQHLTAVSIFYNLPRSKAMEIDMRDLLKASKLAAQKLSEIPTKPKPDFEFTYAGIVFKMNPDINQIKVKKVYDIRKMGEGIIARPGYLVATLYDQQNGQPMSRKEKEELFLKHFPVDEFKALTAFFLTQSETLKLLIFYAENQNLKKMVRLLKDSTGSPMRILFMSWVRTLEGMLMWLRRCITALFYFGKSFSLKKAVGRKNKRT